MYNVKWFSRNLSLLIVTGWTQGEGRGDDHWFLEMVRTFSLCAMFDMFYRPLAHAQNARLHIMEGMCISGVACFLLSHSLKVKLKIILGLPPPIFFLWIFSCTGIPICMYCMYIRSPKKLVDSTMTSVTLSFVSLSASYVFEFIILINHSFQFFIVRKA